MSTYTSKVEVLFKITELKESGDFHGAMKLQKVFIESIKNDRKNGMFSVHIELDRKAKKVAIGVGLVPLTSEPPLRS